MASLASPRLGQQEALRDRLAAWITPEEQLLRFAEPLVKDLIYQCRMRRSINFDKLPTHLSERIKESAARSIVDYSGLPNLKEQASREVKSLFNLTQEKLIEPQPLPTAVTGWYKACSLLLGKKIPKKIPEAPRHIYLILNNKKVPLSLSLVPEEFGTLNRLERDILKPYGEESYPEGENPLQFRYFWEMAHKEHGDVPFAPTHWVAGMEDVLDESRNKCWSDQVALIKNLSEETFLEYTIPNLQQLFTIYITAQVAKRKRLYQAKNESNPSTYGRVTNMTQGYRLCFGGSTSSGAAVSCVYDDEAIGVVPLRRYGASQIKR